MSAEPIASALDSGGQRLITSLKYLNEVGIALSLEKDITRLLENILVAAKRITNADGGTLYRLIDDKLNFEIVMTDSLGIKLGGTSGATVPFYPIPLHDKDGQPNYSMIAAYAALTHKTVNIVDAYTEEGFDFSGTRNFDKKTGYRSRSFLTIPMRNHEGEVIGVLQLLNARSEGGGEVVPFTAEDQRLAESLASQAAIALTNRLLIGQLEVLFESLIELINTAIDDKSPYTGGHCKRVPTLTMMLAEAAAATTEGPLKDFTMTDKDRYELKIAGLLHDCGKITTPVHVVDKATKLETIFDRIELINAKFEILFKQARVEYLEAAMEATNSDPGKLDLLRTEYESRCARYADDREFLQRQNVGGERMSHEDQERVARIADYRLYTSGDEIVPFLTDDECLNLRIPYGTLTPAEREIINNHIVATIKMLEALPWPKHLKNVPEYAGGHHERMDGKGYPKGLKREEMSIQARIMGIADIFEALTAKDRPYKKGKTLSESLEILRKFRDNGHIDPDLFDVFLEKRIFLDYARQFLDPDQIDDAFQAVKP